MITDIFFTYFSPSLSFSCID